MAEYLSPGVYVEEFDSGIKPMEGVGTSTAGFIGMTERGKLTGVPEFVGSYGEFQRKFGGYLPKEVYKEHRYLPMAVEQFFANGGTRCFIVRLLGEEGAATASLDAGGIIFKACSPGAWGNNVVLTCAPSPMDKSLWNLQISCLDASGKPVQQEAFQDVSFDPKSDHYLCKLLEKSLLVAVEYTPGDSDTPDLSERFAAADKREDKKETDLPLIRLEGGADCAEGKSPADAINAALLKGIDGGPGQRTGLNALRDVPEISIVAAPGMVDAAEQQELITHCELMENRVCVLDMPSGMNSVTDLQAFRAKVNTSYAAMYHPWIQVFDPLEKRPAYIPPSGAMIGVYARSDSTRGVYKAPANENIRNCTGLQILFGKPEQDMLNPVGVNLLRNVQGLGIRVWGARTCSSDAAWKYINVRRLFIFIEETIRRNTGWAVFEPNDQLLWTKVRGTISSFLDTLWRNGALAGGGDGDSYFVNIGKGSTMTDDDILNGRLICVIGVAPVRPAEFVIFRITQIMETNS